MNPSGSAKILAIVLLGGLALGLAQGPAAAQLVKGAGLAAAAPGNVQLVADQRNEWFWAGRWWRHGPWADHGPVFGLRLAVVPVIQPVVVVAAHRPWTPAWVQYCASKYRSFDPSTGFYVTYRGERRFCR